jgi:hypothetical protein
MSTRLYAIIASDRREKKRIESKVLTHKAYLDQYFARKQGILYHE